MRGEFARQLYELMDKDESVVFIVGDLGYGMADRIRDGFPDRFYNVGAAEHTMMAMAVGFALSGKRPVVYSITPFLLYRPLEVIRNYINYERIPVVMVGGGRDTDYENMGISHWATDHSIIRAFTNIEFLVPEGEFDLREIIYSDKPTYLNLRR